MKVSDERVTSNIPIDRKSVLNQLLKINLARNRTQLIGENRLTSYLVRQSSLTFFQHKNYNYITKIAINAFGKNCKVMMEEKINFFVNPI